MIRRTAIIATMALGTLAFPGSGIAAGPAFSAFKVQLEVARDGVPVCAQDRTVPAGASMVVPAAPNQQSLRVLQRVTSFPGTHGESALLELQVFHDRAGRSTLVVAPTLGLTLGTPQTYTVPTPQGLMRIHATVTADTSVLPPSHDHDEDGNELPFELTPRKPGPV